MSFDALAWAGRCQPGSAAMKLVLLALADRHNTEENLARPSISWLAEWTGLDRKTVIASLGGLQALGLISDSGQRHGATGQIKAYRLHLETVPKTEQYQKRNSSVFPRKEYRKRDTEPIKEPIPSGAKAPSVSRASGFPEDQQDFRVACVQWAVKEMRWSPGDAGQEFDRFHDNALQHGRQYKDWLAAWRNWCRSPYCKTKAEDDGLSFGEIEWRPAVPVEAKPLTLRPVQ